MKFFVVARGECVLLPDRSGPAYRLETGDAFLFVEPRGFVLASETFVSPVDAHQIYAVDGAAVARIGAAEDTLILGSHVELDDGAGRWLVDQLPALVHLRNANRSAPALEWLVAELVREGEAGLPGATAAQSGLAQLIFLQILRAYLAQTETLDAGVLRVVGDARLAPALRLMHSDPARNWHLPELASATAMSRTAFATRFKAAAGMGPLAYLTQWRMQLAQKRLRRKDIPVATLAAELGYSSEASFSTAFKRVMGHAPKRRPLPTAS